MNTKPDSVSQKQLHNGSTNNADQPIYDVPLFKRKRVLIPFLLTFLVVALFGYGWYKQRQTWIATDDAVIESYRVSISSRVLGRIVYLAVDEGDTVKKGDTLVRLDDADLRAQMQKAEAAYRYLTRNVELQSVNKNRAVDDYSRTEKQFKNQIVSQEQFSHADNARQLAQAQTDLASTQIATAQADLAIVKTQIANTVIIAPFSGVIAKRWVLSGDVVSPGQAIFSLFDYMHPWVTANYEETKLRSIRPGMRVSISIDAYPGQKVIGKVESIGRSTASQFSLIPTSSASGNFTKITQRIPVKIAIDKAPETVSLLPGLSTAVRIFIK